MKALQRAMAQMGDSYRPAVGTGFWQWARQTHLEFEMGWC